jgi:hypothetical protein
VRRLPPSAGASPTTTRCSPTRRVSCADCAASRARSTTGRLILAREQNRQLNTHFRVFDRPMGLAVAPGRLAIGTRTQVWDLRDMPSVAAKLEPAGSHDAC